MLKVIKGDLFDTKAKYLVHQANCITSRAAHLAYDVFRRYPYADVYSPRKETILKDSISEPDVIWSKDTPGDIIIKGNGKDQRYVVALLGQYYPGRPRYPNSELDGTIARQKYFHQALWKLAQVKDLESVAFPYGVGCAAAGGNWEVYHKMICNFAKYLDDKADVFIYHKE
ncbi:hypothetical protein LCGC14_0526200 [marine sediment metagenome]|uniref:Macro domain-containing protein n=1 Tax=marine sediment metagenome TaxID=412755 RepID=A0A0F9RX41_9ZZZZ